MSSWRKEGSIRSNAHYNLCALWVMLQGDREALQNVRHTCTSPDPDVPNDVAPQDNGGGGFEGGRDVEQAGPSGEGLE